MDSGEKQSLLEQGSINNGSYKEIPTRTSIEQDSSSSSNWKNHLKLFLSFIACICATSPLIAFPTLEPFLVDAKAFASFCHKGIVGCNQQELQLSTMYTSVNGLTLATSIISGVMYDLLGPKLSAVIGAIGSGVGLVTIWVALLHEKLSYLLYLGFLLSSFMGFLNSMALYGFIWHYPKNQAFVIGLSNASIQLSALLGTIFPSLINKFHIPLGFLFLLCGGISFVAAAICVFSIPTKKEFQMMAALYIPDMGEEKEEGIFISIWRKIKDTWDVMLQYKRDNILFFMASTVAYIFILTWISSLYPFLSDLFHSETKGQSLADTYSLIYSIMGSVSAPLLGTLLDKLGMVKFYGMMNILVVGFAALFVLPYYSAQICGFIFGLLYFNVWGSAVGQWAVYYAPANLLGTFYGIFFSGSGIVQFAFTLIAPPLMEKYVGGIKQYLFLLIPLAGASILLQLVELINMWKKGIPAIPPTVTQK